MSKHSCDDGESIRDGKIPYYVNAGDKCQWKILAFDAYHAACVIVSKHLIKNSVGSLADYVYVDEAGFRNRISQTAETKSFSRSKIVRELGKV